MSRKNSSNQEAYNIFVEIGEISDQYGSSVNQTLDHAIRIGIKKNECIKTSDDVHFLQFITRQYVDLFGFNDSEGKVVQWNSGGYFTADSTQPCWRVDTAHTSNPFYEAKGSFEKTKDAFIIADQPEFFNSDVERIIATTFLITKDETGDFQVIKEVRWSRQLETREGKDYENYCYEIYECSQLPDWALYTLQDQYKTNEHGSYEIPDFLNRELDTTKKSLQAARLESGKHFLSAPTTWKLRQDKRFQSLFEQSEEDTKKERDDVVLELTEEKQTLHENIKTQEGMKAFEKRNPEFYALLNNNLFHELQKTQSSSQSNTLSDDNSQNKTAAASKDKMDKKDKKVYKFS